MFQFLKSLYFTLFLCVRWQLNWMSSKQNVHLVCCSHIYHYILRIVMMMTCGNDQHVKLQKSMESQIKNKSNWRKLNTKRKEIGKNVLFSVLPKNVRRICFRWGLNRGVRLKNWEKQKKYSYYLISMNMWSLSVKAAVRLWITNTHQQKSQSNNYLCIRFLEFVYIRAVTLKMCPIPYIFRLFSCFSFCFCIFFFSFLFGLVSWLAKTVLFVFFILI